MHLNLLNSSLFIRIKTTNTIREREFCEIARKKKIYNIILNLTSMVSSANPNFSKQTKGYRDMNITACN